MSIYPVHLLLRKISNLGLILALGLPACVAAQSPAPIGELFATETTAHGPALLAGTGMSVTSGSQVAAGRSPATLRLVRGGELRICPNASLTVSAPQSDGTNANQELMMAMDAGTVEVDYPVNDLADTLITPDFKLMLAGPGVFHFALGVNSKGDTCIKPMRGNSASVIVSEMMGTGVYQVRPDQAIMFAGGKLSGRTALDSECGCPLPAPVIQTEEIRKSPAETPAVATTSVPTEKAEAAATVPAEKTEAGPAPPEKTDTVRMQVDVPMVFLGDRAVQPVYAIAQIKFSALPNLFSAQENSKPIVLKPGKGEVSAKGKEKKGFFGRIKGFFASIFHK